MFSGNFRHPLDNLIRDDSLFMLEAILPFVSDNMKAPLAMYIKIMELQSILSTRTSITRMTSCPLLPHAVFLMSRDNLQISKK